MSVGVHLWRVYLPPATTFVQGDNGALIGGEGRGGALQLRRDVDAAQAVHFVDVSK